MPAALKRKRAAESPPAGAAGSVLIFAPGAGGSTAKAMIELHRQLEAEGVHVYRCDGGWNIRSPGHAANLSRVIDVAQTAAADHPDALRIVLGGASFGNRVLAELLRTRFDDLPPKTCFALLSCGYPLHAPGKPEGADPGRTAHLTQLPATCLVFFMQGTEDDYLGPRGIVALRDVVANMSAQTQIYEVAGGTHTVPEAKGLAKLALTKAQVVSGVRDAILRFLACPEGEPQQASVGRSGVVAAPGEASASVIPSPPRK
jgi:predicted alpha/beta-hydrolase family hydrolase